MFDIGCQSCYETHEAANIKDREFVVFYSDPPDTTKVWIDLCDFCYTFAPKEPIYLDSNFECHWIALASVQMTISQNIWKAKTNYLRNRFHSRNVLGY